MESQLIDLFARKSTEELLQIVTTERHTYQNAAVQTAADILKARGIHYQVTHEEILPEQNKPNQVSSPIGPFIVGALMATLGFVELPITMDYEAAWTVTITLNIFVRIVVVAWTYSLATDFKLNKKLWIIVGVIFGGWSLIAIGIAIWTKTSESTIVKEDTQTISQDNEVLENCPACDFKLDDKAKSCPDCGLTLSDT